MKALRMGITALSLTVLAARAGAAPPPAPGAPAQHEHALQALADAKWGPAPPFLPPGAQIVVLAGNPMAAEPYSVRLLFPAGYDVPAHSHPTDENVTVVSGRLFMGMGDTLDRAAAQPLGVGGFARMPAGANHYAFAKEKTTIVLHGMGPVEFKYVNPADDPRNAKTGSKK
ncbi:MAG: cupin domain-containing protein [Acidobacteriota bacterium]|nr:cupin domain-containing protein [Acidobacteriota bacterium]